MIVVEKFIERRKAQLTEQNRVNKLLAEAKKGKVAKKVDLSVVDPWVKLEKYLKSETRKVKRIVAKETNRNTRAYYEAKRSAYEQILEFIQELGVINTNNPADTGK